MSDKLPTMWPADAHTLAKHRILENYLQAWMPILSSQASQVGGNREIVFIDGFAGPGIYEHGQRGSPVIALEAALNHTRSFPVPVQMIFIEKDPDRYEQLRMVLSRHGEALKGSAQVREPIIRCGDCDELLNQILEECERKNIAFGPALVFLDQFGFSSISMHLIQRILKFPQCEVFSYLDFTGINRFITDSGKGDALTRAYGNDDWRQAIPLPPIQREDFLRELYRAALKKYGGAKYVAYFAMSDASGKLLYWLFFSTRNLRGLEEMKRAMWKVDQKGEFHFSDRQSENQLCLIANSTQEWLANRMVEKLKNEAMTVMEIKEYVLTRTACVMFVEALSTLEDQHRIKILSPPKGRRKGTFEAHPDMIVSFTSDLLF